MTDHPSVTDPGAARRAIEIRLSMREVLVVHGALREKQVDLEKDAWHAGRTGDGATAARLNEQAAECSTVAERLFAILSGMMETRR